MSTTFAVPVRLASVTFYSLLSIKLFNSLYHIETRDEATSCEDLQLYTACLYGDLAIFYLDLSVFFCSCIPISLLL